MTDFKVLSRGSSGYGLNDPCLIPGKYQEITDTISRSVRQFHPASYSVDTLGEEGGPFSRQ
jgi:hypothetical protein